MAALRNRRTIFLCFSYVLAIFAGWSQISSNPLLTDVLFPWLVAFTLVIACSTDARIVGKPVPNIVQFLMLITWPLAIPICLIWTRRWWGVLWVLVFGVTLWLTGFITANLVYHFVAG
jgi:hypothetical protein